VAGDGTRWNGKRMVQVPVGDDALDALLQALVDNLSLLPARQRRLLDLCCCQSKTLSQAAVELGFCISWASRLRAQALATLRAAAKMHTAFPHRRGRLGRDEKYPGDSVPMDRRGHSKRNGSS
jgi:hypothetical protein